MATESHTDPEHHTYGVRSSVVERSAVNREGANSNFVARTTDLYLHIGDDEWSSMPELVAGYTDRIFDALRIPEHFMQPACSNAGGRHESHARVAQLVR